MEHGRLFHELIPNGIHSKSVSEFQKLLHKHCTTIRACKHESDYAVLYNDIDLDHLLCHSCWNREEPVRLDADTAHISSQPDTRRAGTVHAVRMSRRRRTVQDVFRHASTRLWSIHCGLADWFLRDLWRIRKNAIPAAVASPTMPYIMNIGKLPVDVVV